MIRFFQKETETVFEIELTKARCGQATWRQRGTKTGETADLLLFGDFFWRSRRRVAPRKPASSERSQTGGSADRA
jgi:hypothetical protein